MRSSGGNLKAMAQRGAREVEPSRPLQGEVVDLDHHAVDLVVEVVTVRLPAAGRRRATSCEPVDQPRLGVDREPGLPEPAERGRLAGAELGGRAGPLRPGRRHDLADLVGPERERPRLAVIAASFWRSEPAAELRGLTNRRSPGLGLAPVEVLEGGDRHVDLAAHLEHARGRAARPRVETIGHGGDGGHVGGHVLAGDAVAPGGGLDEPAPLVGERDGQRRRS